MLDEFVNNDLGLHNLIVEGIDAHLVARIAGVTIAFVEAKRADWTQVFADITLEHVVGDVQGIAKYIEPEEIDMRGAATVACGEKSLFGV